MLPRFLRQQGLAILALLVALSGGAYAAAQLPRNSVGPVQIKPNAVSGPKVRDGSIDLRDLTARARPTPATPQVQQFGTVAPSGTCADDDENGEVCAGLEISLARSSSLSVQARSGWGTPAFNDPTGPSAPADAVNATDGSCVIRVDEQPVPESVARVGETRAAAGGSRVLLSADGYYTGSMATAALVPTVPAGVHTIDLFCTEVDGDVDWTRAGLTAIAVPR